MAPLQPGELECRYYGQGGGQGGSGHGHDSERNGYVDDRGRIGGKGGAGVVAAGGFYSNDARKANEYDDNRGQIMKCNVTDADDHGGSGGVGTTIRSSNLGSDNNVRSHHPHPLPNRSSFTDDNGNGGIVDDRRSYPESSRRLPLQDDQQRGGYDRHQARQWQHDGGRMTNPSTADTAISPPRP